MSGIRCEMYEDSNALAEIQRLTMGAEFQRQPATGRSMIRQRDGLAVTGQRLESAGLAGVEEMSRPSGTMLSNGHDVVDDVRRKLAARHPLLDVGDVEAAALALSHGERDAESLASALLELWDMEPQQIQRLAVKTPEPAARKPQPVAGRAMMRTTDGRVTTIELTAAQEQELGLTAAADDPVEDYLALADSSFGTPSSFKTPFEVHDTGTVADGSPTDSRSAAEIARLLKAHPGCFSPENRKVDSGVRVSKPLSRAARKRSEERELAGGRP
jgi:hypothetical protein